MATVRLSKDLKLPAAELATKIVAALGMRGSGKSNVMASIAEQLLAARIQVLVLDDVGIWFALRLQPDGKTPSGLDIPVMGGRHGDIPLLPTAGDLVARTLAETGSSAVQEAGAPGREQVNNELPGLATGEALVWSPSWLRIFERTKLPKKATYDAGATPLTARAQVKTRPLELGKLSEAMAAVTEEAKANDPKALKAEVARLRAELAKPGLGRPTPPAPPTKPAIPGRVVEALDEVHESVQRVIEDVKELAGEARTIAQRLEGARLLLVKQMPPIRGASPPEAHLGTRSNGVQAIIRPMSPPPRTVRTTPAGPSFGGDGSDWRPTGGAIRILKALATSMADGMTWRQLATLAGMKPTGGGFNNYKSALRVHGCVDERGDLVFLTEAGRGWVGDVGPPPSGPELVEFWRRKLPGKAGLMLEVVLNQGPITKAELGRAVEMEAGGGGFNNYLSSLRSNGLVNDVDGGLAPAEVFLR
jgi:hypothetical protein